VRSFRVRFSSLVLIDSLYGTAPSSQTLCSKVPNECDAMMYALMKSSEPFPPAKSESVETEAVRRTNRYPRFSFMCYPIFQRHITRYPVTLLREALSTTPWRTQLPSTIINLTCVNPSKRSAASGTQNQGLPRGTTCEALERTFHDEDSSTGSCGD
jgi:hypothetical protein